MVFAHDWSAFYLIKTLGVTEFSVLSTLGFRISRKKEYSEHLFNRLYKALNEKFGHEIKKEFEMEVQSLWLWFSDRQCLGVSLHNFVIQIQIKPSHWFDIDPESDNWIRECQRHCFTDATCDQIRHNLVKTVKTVNAIMSS